MIRCGSSSRFQKTILDTARVLENQCQKARLKTTPVTSELDMSYDRRYAHTEIVSFSKSLVAAKRLLYATTN